jgi:hypothetical protein
VTAGPTLLAWLGGLLVVVLLVATLVALVRLLVPELSMGRSRALAVALVVLATVGAVAVSGASGMLFMHLAMRLTGCCEPQ